MRLMRFYTLLQAHLTFQWISFVFNLNLILSVAYLSVAANTLMNEEIWSVRLRRCIEQLLNSNGFSQENVSPFENCVELSATVMLLDDWHAIYSLRCVTSPQHSTIIHKISSCNFVTQNYSYDDTYFFRESSHFHSREPTSRRRWVVCLAGCKFNEWMNQYLRYLPLKMNIIYHMVVRAMTRYGIARARSRNSIYWINIWWVDESNAFNLRVWHISICDLKKPTAYSLLYRTCAK